MRRSLTPEPTRLRAGDVVEVDFGTPVGSEAGFRRPSVVLTATAVLHSRPRVLHVAPVTSTTRRDLPTEVPLEGRYPDYRLRVVVRDAGGGLEAPRSLAGSVRNDVAVAGHSAGALVAWTRPARRDGRTDAEIGRRLQVAAFREVAR